MAKSFTDLATRAKETWSDDTRRVYDAASAVFRAEVDEREDPAGRDKSN